MSNWWVEIVHTEDGKVVKRLGPHTERTADKIADGMSINLNYDKYHVTVEEES